MGEVIGGVPEDIFKDFSYGWTGVERGTWKLAKRWIGG